MTQMNNLVEMIRANWLDSFLGGGGRCGSPDQVKYSLFQKSLYLEEKSDLLCYEL
jgi:hypothetical protein